MAMTWNMQPIPAVATMLAVEIIVGAVVDIVGAATVNVNSCSTVTILGAVPLLAVTVKVYVPTGTVEAMEIRPVALSIVTPAGTVPVSPKVIGASPVAVTWNVLPATTVALLAEVIVGATGAAVTVKVNVCGVLPAALLAVIVNV